MDLTGKTFGYLLVMGRCCRDKGGQWMWICCCECKTIHTVRTTSLTKGKTKSWDDKNDNYCKSPYDA